MTNLIDTFRAFPGGVAKLAEATSLSVDTIYRVANGTHARKPVRALNSLAEALPCTLLGEETTYDALERKWTALQEEKAR